MEFIDARRLTGPNLFTDQPACVLDICCADTEVEQLAAIWKRCLEEAFTQVDWPPGQQVVAPLGGGVSLVFTAPINRLYAGTAINEWAWACIEANHTGQPLPAFGTALPLVQEALAEEDHPGLLEIQQAALEHGVPFLWDDDEVSLGLGRGVRRWPTNDLPAPDDLNWDSFGTVPVGIITGTNGKTTTTRLATSILQLAGQQVGLSSTDWIAVNNEVIDRGDWSGPGGARAVLRRCEVTAAVLETARGGLLRRGLAVEEADAALITNIAADHLGDFGSSSLDELLEIKWIVSRVVSKRGVLILNADDERLVARAARYSGKIVWFSLNETSAVVSRHREQGGRALLLKGDRLTFCEGKEETTICTTAEISITLNGAARHNVANALAAAALTDALGASLEQIRQGLRTITQEDNPGRCNIFAREGVQVLVDFAHNPHAMHALFDMARAIPAARRLLMLGQAGDRTDALLREVTAGAWSIGLDMVLITGLEKYRRGREVGEVPLIIEDELLKRGATRAQIEHFELETEALAFALDWAASGDLVILLAMDQRSETREMLLSLGFTPK